MAQGIFKRQTGALRETYDHQTFGTETAVLAGFQDRLVTPFDGGTQVGLIQFPRIPKTSGVPTARSLGLGNHPADPFEIADPSG